LTLLGLQATPQVSTKISPADQLMQDKLDKALKRIEELEKSAPTPREEPPKSANPDKPSAPNRATKKRSTAEADEEEPITTALGTKATQPLYGQKTDFYVEMRCF